MRAFANHGRDIMAHDAKIDRRRKKIVEAVADSLKEFSPVIQWGAVSGKWHVTLLDGSSKIYTGDTILRALLAAANDPDLLNPGA